MAKKTKPPAAEITTADLLAATKKLPRAGMSDFDGARAAAQASKAARETQTLEQTEAQYTRLLTLLAEKRTPEAVATAMGWSAAGLEVFLTEHRSFAQRWDTMRKRLVENERLPQPTLVAIGDVEWSEDKRNRLLEAYVDTGDLLSAQTLVGITPSQFNREVETNPEFGERVKQAKKQASNTLELRAIKDALGGNDKLLSQILRGKDESNVAQLTDAQLARRITGLLGRIRSRLAAGGDQPTVAGGAASAPGESRGSGASTPAQQVPDAFSADGLI